MGFLKVFQKAKTRQHKYKLCRNKYGYYKIMKEYWWVFPFAFWPIWTCGSYWQDVRHPQSRPGITARIRRFKTKREASEYIKEIRRKEKEANNDWTACRMIK